MSETEWAEYQESLDSEDPVRCDGLYDWADEGAQEDQDPEMMEWCSKPWGHQYPDRGGDIRHQAINPANGRVIVEWSDPTELFLKRY
jgi:hypothetical protein